MTSATPDPQDFAGRPLARARKRSEQVAREIVRTLHERKWPVGTALPTEDQMRTMYGVGRTTLREALRILEVYGLIAIRPGKSGGPRLGSVGPAEFGQSATFFYSMTGATFHELSEARLSLEPMIARMAAERRSEADIAELDDLVTRAEHNDDPVRSVDLSLRFHAKVGEIARNGVLALVSASFEEISRSYSSESLESALRDDVIRVHRRIADAIDSGDSDEAERLMRRHMEESARDFAERNPRLSEHPVDWI